MSREFTVRRYETGDTESVKRLHDERSWNVEYPESEQSNTDTDLDDIHAEYIDAGGEFVVGLEGDRLVATGGFVPVDDETVSLRRLRVDPAYQGQGYGRRILEALESRADEAGYDAVLIDEAGLNRDTRSFLEANGYEMTNRALHLGTELLSYRKPLA